mmetsp:Transcript_29857/g.68540  ORF Transcript_29857/g.68540 Transcript_29857/m.68540 type:complete len:288 (+) Transcript_29857:72-935(+)
MREIPSMQEPIATARHLETLQMIKTGLADQRISIFIWPEINTQKSLNATCVQRVGLYASSSWLDNRLKRLSMTQKASLRTQRRTGSLSAMPWPNRHGQSGSAPRVRHPHHRQAHRCPIALAYALEPSTSPCPSTPGRAHEEVRATVLERIVRRSALLGRAGRICLHARLLLRLSLRLPCGELLALLRAHAALLAGAEVEPTQHAGEATDHLFRIASRVGDHIAADQERQVGGPDELWLFRHEGQPDGEKGRAEKSPVERLLLPPLRPARSQRGDDEQPVAPEAQRLQ